MAPFEVSVGAASAAVPLRPQLAANWCWAACVEMIVTWKDERSTLRQCELASRQFMAMCCTSPVTVVCDQPLSIGKIQPLWHDHGVGAVYFATPLDPQFVLNEVSAGRPVQLAIFRNRAGHVVLVSEAADDPSKVVVLDPAPRGQGTRTVATLDHLRSGLDIGRWRFTWTGLN